MDGNTNWRGMFEQQRPSGRGLGAGTSTAPPLAREEPPDQEDDREIDLADYRPWVLQRGRSRPAALLDLRWYDARASLWLGCAVAYPQLAAVEYVGEKMLSLDCGKRQFVIEGDGLGELVRRIQDGSVIAIQAYAGAVWPHRPERPIVTNIRKLEAGAR